MAFDIGKYNGDFKAFVDFASAAKKGSAIAQLGGDKNAVAGTGALAGRSIVAKTTRDSIGNVGRLSGSRDRLVVSALVADDLPPAPSRQLVCDLLDLGFGMMEDGLPAVARDPETGFLAAFAIFPLATLSPAEFPDAFDKFAAFATALADRLDAERAGVAVTPEGEPPADGESPTFGDGLISV